MSEKFNEKTRSKMEDRMLRPEIQKVETARSGLVAVIEHLDRMENTKGKE